jgi:hypothetical protein
VQTIRHEENPSDLRFHRRATFVELGEMELEIAEAGDEFFPSRRTASKYFFPKAHNQTMAARQQEDPDLSSEANHNSTMLSWRKSGLSSEFSSAFRYSRRSQT